MMKIPMTRYVSFSTIRAASSSTTVRPNVLCSSRRAAFSSHSASSTNITTTQHQSSPSPNAFIPPAPVAAPPTSPSSLFIREYPYAIRVGTVTSAERMNHTVRVAHRHTTWDKQIRKQYAKVTTYLVSDPRNSLREGDVIEFSSGAPKSRRVHHVVERIISPFGIPIEDRPLVMSREERNAERTQKRAKKLQRREQRKSPDPPSDQLTHSSSRGDHMGRIRRLVLERLAEANRTISKRQNYDKKNE